MCTITRYQALFTRGLDSRLIEDTPLKYSAPLSIGRSLLAVGGMDDRLNLSSWIHLYQPDTRRWVKVGDLPTARHSCTCSVLPSGDVIVAGGVDEHRSLIDTVDFLSINQLRSIIIIYNYYLLS